MRVGFFGNCQVQGFADSVKAFAPDIEVSVHTAVGLKATDKAVTDGVLADLSTCDVVFMQALETRRAGLPELIDAVVGSHPAAHRFPLLAFRGFHPDCGHVNRDGARVAGALGPYHSILACAGWLEGLEPDRTAALFNTFSSAALGYFEVHGDARAVLTEQAAAVGYDISAWFAPGQRAFMHTVNHPTAGALHDLARQGLDLAGIRREAEAALPKDRLADDPIWPVYPELARRLGLPDPVDEKDFRLQARSLVEANYLSLQHELEARGPWDAEEPSQANGAQIARARGFIRDRVLPTR